ncbi:MAG: DUF1571 domain-containing protein [Phycisphaerae bacterium]
MRIRYRHSILAIVGLLAVALTVMNHLSTPLATAGQPLTAPVAYPEALTPTAVITAASLPRAIAATAAVTAMAAAARAKAVKELAQNAPGALARLSRQRYDREVHDYTCVFLKQERIGGKLREVEEIEVRYRDDPTTVYMIWKRNAGQAKRVLFIDSAEFVNDNGEKVARVEPAGALIRLIVSDVLMPIHGKRARQTSRRFIDEFGFRATLDLLKQYNQLGEEHRVLDFHYAGEGEIDGRLTYKLVRYLPYDGPDGIWPDAKMVMHLDQEWLLPTAVYSYADREGQVLLGSYVHTQVKLNPGLDDEAFKF